MVKRKIKAILKILFCKNYILVTRNEDEGLVDFDLTMDSTECKRMGLFLHNFLQESDSVLNEALDIINNSDNHK